MLDYQGHGGMDLDADATRKWRPKVQQSRQPKPRIESHSEAELTHARRRPKPKQYKLKRNERTLVVLLRSLLGMSLVIELKNDVTVSGVLDEVDMAMK